MRIKTNKVVIPSSGDIVLSSPEGPAFEFLYIYPFVPAPAKASNRARTGLLYIKFNKINQFPYSVNKVVPATQPRFAPTKPAASGDALTPALAPGAPCKVNYIPSKQPNPVKLP